MQKYWNLNFSFMMYALKKPSNFYKTSQDTQNMKFSIKFDKAFALHLSFWVNKYKFKINSNNNNRNLKITPLRMWWVSKKSKDYRKWSIIRREKSKILSNTIRVWNRRFRFWCKNNKMRENTISNKNRRWSNRWNIWNKRIRNALRLWSSTPRITSKLKILNRLELLENILEIRYIPRNNCLIAKVGLTLANIQQFLLYLWIRTRSIRTTYRKHRRNRMRKWNTLILLSINSLYKIETWLLSNWKKWSMTFIYQRESTMRKIWNKNKHVKLWYNLCILIWIKDTVLSS